MEASKIIDSLGGSTAVAKLCGVCPNAVSNWKTRGIPPKVLLKYSSVFVAALVKEEPKKDK